MEANGRLQQDIILGIGGDKPGLSIYDTKSGGLKRILSLPLGQSVYSVDTSGDGRLIGAGTKGGGIFRLTFQSVAANHNYQAEQLGSSVLAPVLSVCFVDEQTFAVSDTAARCLLFSPGQTEPDRLPTGKRVISALFRLDDRHLAGLSLAGELVIWNWAGGEIIQVVQVPAPPEELAALVQPVRWHKADRWVWPSRDGLIVLYGWPRNEVRAICGHTSQVYAIVPHQDDLLTIGIDGLAQHWRVGTDEPVGSCEIADQILSVALWGQPESRKLVLTNNKGRAGVYLWTDGQVNFIEWLHGEEFRIAVGPDMQKVESALHRQRAMKAREICTQIKEAMGRRECSISLDSQHQQLVQLGYEHVSLALRAEEHRINNDVVSEFQSYKKLTDLVPETDERTEGSLLRYATLLETLWQPKEACSVFRKLAQRFVNNCTYADKMRRASECAGIMENGEYVVESETPLPSLLKSATVLDKMLNGRFLIKIIEAPINCKVIISAGELINKYEQICQTKSGQRLPQPREAQLWWLGHNKTEQVTTVIFASADSGFLGRVEVGLKLLDANLQTVLVPAVIFNAGKKADSQVSAEQHNQALLRLLEPIINDDPSFKGWLAAVYGNIREAVRQLITRGMADRNR